MQNRITTNPYAPSLCVLFIFGITSKLRKNLALVINWQCVDISCSRSLITLSRQTGDLGQARMFMSTDSMENKKDEFSHWRVLFGGKNSDHSIALKFLKFSSVLQVRLSFQCGLLSDMFLRSASRRWTSLSLKSSGSCRGGIRRYNRGLKSWSCRWSANRA